jgi:LAO/AO transport system kinase
MDLLSQVEAREVRAIARALTLVENADTAFLAALDARFRTLPQPARVGITGPPGAGKSTLTSGLVAALRRRDNRVGVVAVDPTSPFSGGALLGDRVRMREHILDPDVFMRSMANRGHFGGLATGTHDACDVLALAGFDPLIVETVGVGQSEVEIARLADTTVVVLTPSAGDSVQALKAGIMEVADIVVINKVDSYDVDLLEDDIREALELRPHGTGPLWQPPIVRTVALVAEGVDKLAAEIDRHREHLKSHGLLEPARAARELARLDSLAATALASTLHGKGRTAGIYTRLREQVTTGTLAPRAAVKSLLDQLGDQ